MISILIPIYNRDARLLVREIVQQADKLGIIYEVLCLDDHSIFYLDKNIQIQNYQNCTYTVLPQNIGQSATRNRLADMAKFDYLLYIDCDIKIDYHHYLRNYIEQIPNSDLVCGGIHYLPWPPTSEYLLHWMYGTRREMRQSMKAYHFLSCNFMIRKSIFNKIRFNEDVVEYGHDNIYFGIELNKLNIARKHVFSPAAHNQLDYTDEFIERVKDSIYVASNYLRDHDVTFSQVKGYKFAKTYLIIKKLKLSFLISKLFFLISTPIEKNLRGKYPILLLLDFYKVGLLSYYMHNKRKIVH